MEEARGPLRQQRLAELFNLELALHRGDERRLFGKRGLVAARFAGAGDDHAVHVGRKVQTLRGGLLLPAGGVKLSVQHLAQR